MNTLIKLGIKALRLLLCGKKEVAMETQQKMCKQGIFCCVKIEHDRIIGFDCPYYSPKAKNCKYFNCACDIAEEVLPRIKPLDARKIIKTTLYVIFDFVLSGFAIYGFYHFINS